jgi:pimeloyl-ACP methyl ester carboxylesterase
MGALIAANVAARYPTRTKTVTLVAGAFYSLSDADNQQLIDDLRNGKGLTRLIQRVFPDREPHVIADMNAQMLAQNDVPSLIAVTASRGALDITRDAAPNVPALIICGTEDALLPDSQKLTAWWPGARFVEAPGAGHSVAAVFNNSDTTEALRAFMK